MPRAPTLVGVGSPHITAGRTILVPPCYNNAAIGPFIPFSSVTPAGKVSLVRKEKSTPETVNMTLANSPGPDA